ASTSCAEQVLPTKPAQGDVYHNSSPLNLKLGLVRSRIRPLPIFPATLEDSITIPAPRSRREGPRNRILPHCFVKKDWAATTVIIRRRLPYCRGWASTPHVVNTPSKIFQPSLSVKSNATLPKVSSTTSLPYHHHHRRPSLAVDYSQDDSPHTQVADRHTQLSIAPAEREVAAVDGALGDGYKKALWNG
ncbi:hypothetical protein FRB90_007481, partial [Tulasnella sp. 427]